ncbi:SRPBCC family protein [Streptomyces ovatisporus]|uniref:SRPBCC family protein n=1 Tax=Streptomyces ovatisporus TaxID=1128682 RepID=A0ABV9A379_9ACTN
MPEEESAKNAADGGGSGLDRVREELSNYLTAKTSNLVSSAGGKVSGLAQKVAEGGGPGGGDLPKMGAKLLQGESPAKAVGGQMAKKVKDKTVGKVQELFGGGGEAGDKKVTNIVEVLDVGLPLRRVYDHWTEFEEFSGFMKGVVEASRGDDDVTSDWTGKVGPSKRSWQATVLEQVPDNRIVWKSSGEATTHGSISFHELAPNLTRIVVVVEYSPGGFLEKTANIWRAQGRRLRLDLKHFLRYVSLGAQEVPEGWRGEIREGEVVRSHEDVLAEDEEDEGNGEDENGENGEDEEQDEEQEEEEEEEDGDYEDSDEEEDESDEEGENEER